MGSTLDNVPTVEYKYLVGSLDTIEPMSDEQRRRSLPVRQQFLHQGAGIAGVQMSGWFVKEQYRSRFEERARYCQSLSLAPRNTQPVLTNGRLITLWKPCDECIQLRLFGRGYDLSSTCAWSGE